MPRQRSPNRDKAFKIYKQYKGDITNKEIANMLNEKENTISNWKSRDVWNNECSTTNNECSTTNEKTQLKTKKKIDKSLIKSVEENEDLTDKQRLFCVYYVDNFNARLSAIRAGYSPATATEIGYENLQKLHIKKEIKRLKKIKSESLFANNDDVVERFMRIAFANMNDFIDFGQEKIETTNIEGKAETYKENFVHFKSSDEVDGSLISEISVGKSGSKIKLKDSQKALEWLSRYFNMFPMDKHKIDFDNRKLELESKKIKEEDNQIQLIDAWVDAVLENDDSTT